MNVQQRFRRRIVIAGLLLVGVGFVATSELLHDKADAVIVWAEGIIAMQPHLGMVVFVLLAMISAMVSFFSSAILVPVAVYAWGKVACFLLLWSGWLLGGIVSFCIGRFLGRKVAGMLVSEERIAALQSQVGQHTRFVHLLFFQAIVPSEIPGYLLGTLRYRFLVYLAALALTELPYVAAAVLLGDSFLKGEGTLIILLGFFVIAVGVLLLSLKKKIVTGAVLEGSKKSREDSLGSDPN